MSKKAIWRLNESEKVQQFVKAMEFLITCEKGDEDDTWVIYEDISVYMRILQHLLDHG